LALYGKRSSLKYDDPLKTTRKKSMKFKANSMVLEDDDESQDKNAGPWYMLLIIQPNT